MPKIATMLNSAQKSKRNVITMTNITKNTVSSGDDNTYSRKTQTLLTPILF